MSSDESMVSYAVYLEEIILRIYKTDADEETNHLVIRTLARQSVRTNDEKYLSLARQIDCAYAENYREAYEFTNGKKNERSEKTAG